MGEIEELNSIFTDIANSIRAKLDVSTSYYPEDMADAIDSISGGGGQTSEQSYEIVTKSIGNYDASITVKKYVDDVLEYSTDYPYQSLQVTPVFFDGLFSLQYAKGGQAQYTLTLYEKSNEHPSGYVYEWGYNVTVDLTETFIVGGGVAILSGTSAPSSQGSNGDIYLQYRNNDMVTLPTGYTALNYIANPIAGSASIDTNVSVTANTSADLIGLEPLQQSRYGTFLGQGNQSGRIWSIRYKESTDKLQFQIGDDNTAIEGSSLTVGERYTIHAENGKLVVNGTEYTGSAMTLGTPIHTLRLFYNGDGERAYARLFRCKIYEDGTMVRDMVAAKYNNDNTIGMYDLVNDVFYTDTSGTLIGGSILVAKEITNAYLKVNGAWQNLIGSDLDNVG